MRREELEDMSLTGRVPGKKSERKMERKVQGWDSESGRWRIFH